MFRRFEPEPNSRFEFGSGSEILYEVQVQVQTKGGLNWTELNFSNASLIIQSPSPLPLLQLQDLQLYLICIPHQHLYYPLHLCLYFSSKISSCTLSAYPTNICITILHQSNPTCDIKHLSQHKTGLHQTICYFACIAKYIFNDLSPTSSIEQILNLKDAYHDQCYL